MKVNRLVWSRLPPSFCRKKTLRSSNPNGATMPVKVMIERYPRNPSDKPYSHLEPIVAALIEGGNQPLRSEIFFLDRDGWRCDLKEPIDFAFLRARFHFPNTLILSAPLDKIFCQNTWVEIKGSEKP